MNNSPQLSDNPRDKLQAALNHDRPDNDLGADYREACAAWFAGLSERGHWKQWRAWPVASRRKKSPAGARVPTKTIRRFR
jgi:hypothetical protein